MEFAFHHGYISNVEFESINDAYEHILSQLVRHDRSPGEVGDWWPNQHVNAKIRPFAVSPFLRFPDLISSCHSVFS